MPDLLLGLDLGTSAVKALLVDAAGAVIGEGGATLRFETPRPRWAEQDPQVWWRGAVDAIRGALAGIPHAAERIAAIGLAGQMHGLTLLDSRGESLRPCILWNDQRSHGECTALEREVGVPELVRLTGNRVFPGFTLPKLLWVRANEPAVFRRVSHALLPKDWLRWRLTGEFASDVSDASGTAMFDVGARRWSRGILERTAIDDTWLPRVFESSEITGTITREAAGATGLRPGTPVVAGAGDQAAAAVGMGIVDDGAISATIGTSGVVFAACSAHTPDPAGRLHAFCHAAPNMWHQMGVMLSAGGALRWFRDVVAPDSIGEASRRGIDSYDVLAERAASVPPGCEGLVFLPYLTGERTPHADPDARGAFVGLTIRHSSAHLARAVFEGVTFGLRDCLDLISAGSSSDEQTNEQRQPIALAGGGARSPFWRQLCADVFGRAVVASTVADAGALGAARLAAVGAGLVATVTDATSASDPTSAQTTPCMLPEVADELATALERYRWLYRALRPLNCLK